MFEAISAAIWFLKYTWWFWVIGVVIIIIISYFSPEEKEKRLNKAFFSEQYNREEVYPWFNHLYGLNIPENAKCELWICQDCLIFYYEIPIVLNYSKIITADYLTNEQITKHYVENTTGAIVGGLAFGPIGALLGGGTKTKYDVEKSYFLTITYKSNNEINTIILDASLARNQAKKFVKNLKNRIPNDSEVIEL